MADSQTDSKFFSVRIVLIDYYMAVPLLGFDICYSSFQGGRVNEVPVIRVYGAIPASQKTCLHLRGHSSLLVISQTGKSFKGTYGSQNASDIDYDF